MFAKGKQVNIPVLITYVRQRKLYFRRLGLDRQCRIVNLHESGEYFYGENLIKARMSIT